MIDNIIEEANYVYKRLGGYLNESIYQKGLKKILEKKYNYNVSTEIIYGLEIDNIPIDGCSLRIDMIIQDKEGNKIIIENKSVAGNISVEHECQIHRYMKISGINTGIIINFKKIKSIDDELLVDTKIISY